MYKYINFSVIPEKYRKAYIHERVRNIVGSRGKSSVGCIAWNYSTYIDILISEMFSDNIEEEINDINYVYDISKITARVITRYNNEKQHIKMVMVENELRPFEDRHDVTKREVEADIKVFFKNRNITIKTGIDPFESESINPTLLLKIIDKIDNGSDI